MKIQQRKIRSSHNNSGFCYTGLMTGATSFYKHKEGVVALHLPKYGNFWNGEKEVLADFIFNEVEYRIGFDKIKNKRSLGLRINNFVKECIRLSNVS
tara:strand:- start:239 stop:529 length:291 start_codon:yes stop_codon:yes gene_type:complete